ncbi:MAG: hypothetical protein Q9216_004956 [Gyalolechia sp. 2 TL-2023]
MEAESDNHSKVLKRTLEEVGAASEAGNSKPCEACVICLDTISERAAASPCSHDSFDFLCLVSWLQERSTCPLCTTILLLRYPFTIQIDDDVGKTEVLTVDYGALSPSGCKSYNVPRRPVKEDLNAPATHQPSRIAPAERLYARTNRRPQRSARPRPPLSADAALLRRKQIYARGLYSLHVGTNRLSRFRDLTPQLFSRDVELVGRARKWIRRELQVFEFLNTDGGEEGGVTRRANNAEFLLEYIVAILKTVDVKGSGGQAEDMLQEFLGRENTRLFLHELRAWLRSPYTSLEDWDRHVQYVEQQGSIEGPEARKRKRSVEIDRDKSRPTSCSAPSRHAQLFPATEQPKNNRYARYPDRSTISRERRHHFSYGNGRGQ